MVINGDISNDFATNILTDNIVVPSALLQSYRQVGLDDTQLVILLHLLACKESRSLEEKISDLSKKMSCGNNDINKGFGLLIEQGFITIDGQLQPEKLLASLKGAWQQYHSHHIGGKDAYDETTSLYTLFEQEFGRLLTPMEGDQIKDWIDIDKYEYSLIKGALKRSVLRGVLNFKYTDSILREWRRKNLRTINEVLSYENQYGLQKEQAKKQSDAGIKKTPITRSKDSKDSKYKDIYMG